MYYYKGYEVLTETPDRGAATTARHERGLSVIASTVGKRLVLDRWGVPSVIRSFTWAAFGRPEVAALRAFIARRKGRVVPCWVPTGQADLTLAQAASAGADRITILRVGYASLVFPTGSGRRHLAVSKRDGTSQAVQITSAIDNQDGTESLVLDSTLPESYPAGAHMSYLVLCRLESDLVRLAFTTPHTAEAQLSFVELPKETPLT